MQNAFLANVSASVITFGWITAAQAAGAPVPGTFDYIAHQRFCVIDQCQTTNAPGRISVLKSGKILIYFATADGSGLQSNGVLLQLGRTVRLSGRGHLPDKIFGGLIPQGGSGSAQFDGQRLMLSVDLTGSGPLNGGSATVSGHFSNVFNLDPTTGAILGGSGQASGTVQGQRADGQPFSGPLTGTASIEGR